LVEEASLGADAGTTATTFFGTELDGRPRFFFAGSSAFSCS